MVRGLHQAAKTDYNIHYTSLHLSNTLILKESSDKMVNLVTTE